MVVIAKGKIKAFVSLYYLNLMIKAVNVGKINWDLDSFYNTLIVCFLTVFTFYVPLPKKKCALLHVYFPIGWFKFTTVCLRSAGGI